MTVVNPKSISGITSITTASGSDNLLTIHTSDADNTERFRIDSTGATRITTGIVTTLTATGSAKVGSGITLSSDGDIFATGITTVSGNVRVGSGITLSPDGNIRGAGISTFNTLETLAQSHLIGAVGIGTTNPQSMLTIVSDSPSVRIRDKNQATDNNTWLLSAGSFRQFRIQALNDSGGGGGELFNFYRNDNDVEEFRGNKGGSPWFTVNNNTKRVGIGTSIPTTNLHTLAGGGANIIEMQRSSTNTTGNTGCINFTASDGHSVANIGAYGAGDNESAYINFKTTTAASANSPFTSTTERFRILASGGVTFNGDTATANALDDYEEGTFTPSYVNLDVPSHATTDYATYTKIGRLVLIRVGLTISGSVNDGSGLGFTLPFAPTSNQRVVIPAISDRDGTNQKPFAMINQNQNSIIYAKALEGFAWQTYNHFSGNMIVITGTYESA